MKSQTLPLKKGQQIIDVNNDILILLLLDYSDFSCQFCSNSFLELCAILQKNYDLHTSMYGILCVDDKNKIDQHIIQKQLKGFKNANNLKFPFILDNLLIFNEVTKKGSVVIILKKSVGVIKKWQFPLNHEAIVKVISFIIDYK